MGTDAKSKSKLTTDAESKSWWRGNKTYLPLASSSVGGEDVEVYGREEIMPVPRLDFDSLEQIEAHDASCDQLSKHFTKYLR